MAMTHRYMEKEGSHRANNKNHGGYKGSVQKIIPSYRKTYY